MIYAFEEYELDTDIYELRRSGGLCQLEPKAFDVLTYLIEHRDRIVSKDELLDQLWHVSYISDAALNSSIMAARRAVGDNGRVQRIIQTHRGRGYRFIAAIDEWRRPKRKAETGEDTFPLISNHSSWHATTDTLEVSRLASSHFVNWGRACMACRSTNFPESLFCFACGVPLARLCGHCDQRVFLPAWFCHMCGTRLDPAPMPRAFKQIWARSPFVGRQSELSEIDACLRKVIKGHGQVVAVIGASGIGKSRFLAEIRCRVQQQSAIYLHVSCSAPTRAYCGLPIHDLIRQGRGDATDICRDTMERQDFQTLQACDLRRDATALDGTPLLRAEAWEGLPAQPPEKYKHDLWKMLRALIEAHCRRQPLIIAIDDVEWLDFVSRDVLTMLASHLLQMPVLLLLTGRYERHLAWLEAIHTKTLVLSPLSATESSQLLRALSTSDISVRCEPFAVNKEFGNPLFVEQIVRWYVECGRGHASAEWPQSLAQVIAQRFSLLAPLSQRLLQTASVVGCEFSLRTLRQLWQRDENLKPDLIHLEAQGWCQPVHRDKEEHYVFAHSCIREVVYASLAPEYRRYLHVEAAQILEAGGGDLSQYVSRELAWYDGHAICHDKAVHYLTSLARQAARCEAHEEVLAITQAALDEIDQLGPEEAWGLARLTCGLEQARALLALGRTHDSVALLQDLLEAFLTSAATPWIE